MSATDKFGRHEVLHTASIMLEIVEQSESHVTKNGTKIWYLPSKGKDYIHRLDGPAIEYKGGSKEWRVNGELHRLDGPAVEWEDGIKEWLVDGKLHRLDGPAVEHINGTKYWFIYGNKLPAKEVETWLEENNVDLKTDEGQMAFKLMWI